MKKQLPKNWVECTLGELATVQSGGTPSRGINSYWNGDIPWVKISDIKEMYVDKTTEFITEEGLKNSSTRIFPKGTILFTIFATLGKIGILNIDAATNQAIAGITPSKSINDKYLTYSLIDLSNSISEYGKGVAQKNINQAILKDTIIPLPPLPEQQRIVAKLDTLFDQLEIIKTSIKNIPSLLKDFRQQVLTQAVTGKLTDCKVEEKRLGDLLIEVKYGTSKKSEYEIDGTPIFRIPNINEGEIDDKDLKFSILDEKEYNQLKLKIGDVLIIRSNGSVSLVGKSAIIREKHIGFAYAGYLIRLRCGEKLNPDFLNYTLKSDFLRTQIVNTSHSSSGVNNINSQEIKDLKLFWTSLKEQQEIVRRVESLFAKADAIEQQYKTLKASIDTLPQALLNKAFKGELVTQLESDGDARDLLEEIQKLKTTTGKVIKSKTNKKAVKKVKPYSEAAEVLGMVAEKHNLLSKNY
jgi:type I restriction enzyme S subunit